MRRGIAAPIARCSIEPSDRLGRFYAFVLLACTLRASTPSTTVNPFRNGCR